jgi:polysaccharide deacetylase 2 family uncharacterized protein YibQ
MSQPPVKKLWAAVLYQYRKPESLLVVCCVFSVIMLVWLLFLRPAAEINQPRSSGPTSAAVAPDIEDPIYAGTLVRQITSSAITASAAVDPAQAVVESQAEKVYIAIILDDIGNNAALGMQAIDLPGAITYAVLPHTPHGEKLAMLAHQSGKEIMLHAPMSNLAQHPLGEGGLTPLLTEAEFTASLLRSIAAVPFAKGVNNHMGSELTSARMQMQWLMRELKLQDLYFVDSLTTASSVAAETAGEFAVPNLRRHVFLDNQATFENIDFEFKRLLEIARTKGSAVGIGHPYPETLAYLEQALATLEAEGIELIPVSRMLELKD